MIKDLEKQIAEEKARINQPLVDKLTQAFKNAEVTVEANSEYNELKVRVFTRSGSKNEVTTSETFFLYTNREGKEAFTISTDATTILMNDVGRVTGTRNEKSVLSYPLIQFVLISVKEFLASLEETIAEEEIDEATEELNNEESQETPAA